MAVYLCLGDIHASDRPPSACTDSYLEDILALLWESVRVAKERSCAGVIWAGDIFHSKAPGRTSHRTVQRIIEIGQSYPCPWFIVPGNHDIQFDKLDSIEETQPLGVLFRAGARRLEGWAAPGVHFKDPAYHPLYGVPWQQDWEKNLFPALASYTQERTSPVLCVAHAPLYRPGDELPYENVPADIWAEAMDGKGFCFYGHVHEPHGVYEVNEVTFCNNGAISRGSLHEYNRNREVCVTLWDDRTGTFERVPLPQKPASEVFRLTEIQEAKDTSRSLDEFLRSIGSSNIPVLSIESILAYVSSLDLSQEDRDLLEELIRDAS